MTQHRRPALDPLDDFPGSFRENWRDDLSLLPDALLCPAELTMTLAEVVVLAVAIFGTVALVMLGG